MSSKRLTVGRVEGGKLSFQMLLLATVDDLVEQIGGVGVVGEGADLISAEQSGPGVLLEFSAQQQRRIRLQIVR